MAGLDVSNLGARPQILNAEHAVSRNVGVGLGDDNNHQRSVNRAWEVAEMCAFVHYAAHEVQHGVARQRVGPTECLQPVERRMSPAGSVAVSCPVWTTIRTRHRYARVILSRTGRSYRTFAGHWPNCSRVDCMTGTLLRRRRHQLLLQDLHVRHAVGIVASERPSELERNIFSILQYSQ